MVSAQLIGRLGNSMFQIAASIGYARKYGYKWAVQERPHNNESAIHRTFPNLPKTTEKGKIFQEHPSKHCAQHNEHYDLCHFNFHDLPDMGENIFLSGFWQSWKYFEHCKEEIKEVFRLPDYGYTHYTSIHVRRGDYVQHSGSFPPITTDYINKALDRIHEGSGCYNAIVFSDDIQWCKENIKHEEFYIEFSEGKNELEDLGMMASCDNHIIANSSFSWWGAYLGTNPQKMVICPSAETWFGEKSGVRQPVKDLLLPEWIQIPTR